MTVDDEERKVEFGVRDADILTLLSGLNPPS